MTVSPETSRLAELREITESCVHCGFCLPACPTYDVLGDENDSPRGRIHLAKQLATGVTGLGDGVAEHFDACLGCLACVPACPTGVRYDRIIEHVRPVVAEARESRRERLVRALIFAIFPHPWRLRVAATLGVVARRLGLLALVRRIDLLATLGALLPRTTLRDLVAPAAIAEITNPARPLPDTAAERVALDTTAAHGATPGVGGAPGVPTASGVPTAGAAASGDTRQTTSALDERTAPGEFAPDEQGMAQETVPDAAASNMAAPDAAIPAAAAPNGAVPHSAAPVAAAPDGAVPHHAVPHRAIPDATLPGAAAPGAAVPDVAVPGAAVPVGDVPDSDVPHAAGLNTGGPSAAVPDGAVPDAAGSDGAGAEGAAADVVVQGVAVASVSAREAAGRGADAGGGAVRDVVRDVAVITGCVQRVLFAEVNAATVRVLAADGCRVRVPRAQGCCGALSLHAGRVEEARQYARRLIDDLSRGGCDESDAVIVNVAGCGSMLKEYGELLADDPDYAARAAVLAERVRDVTEVIAELPDGAPRQTIAVRVAYHDACHLSHGQGVRDEPRQVLGAVPGLDVVEPSDQGFCCGSAGIYNLTEPVMAAELGRRKADRIRETGAEAVVAGNPGCLLQIQRYLDIPAMHPVQVIDASIRGEQLPS